jgi:S1-C subfamily serine protease
MQNKSRNILSILALIIFLSIIYLIGSTSRNPNESNLYDRLTNKLGSDNGILSKLFPANSKYGGIIKSEVVQEESAIVDVIDAVSPAVVSVVVRTYGFDPFSGPSTSEEGIGTGFIVDPKGLIITNSHVVDSPDGEYSVVMKDGNTFDVKKFI